MSSTSRQLRDHAGALRRAADRLTLLRLRLSNTIGEVSRSEAPVTRRLDEEIHERWSRGEYAERGRIVTGRRSSAGQLEEIATEADGSGRQGLGGSCGA